MADEGTSEEEDGKGAEEGIFYGFVDKKISLLAGILKSGIAIHLASSEMISSYKSLVTKPQAHISP